MSHEEVIVVAEADSTSFPFTMLQRSSSNWSLEHLNVEDLTNEDDLQQFPDSTTSPDQTPERLSPDFLQGIHFSCFLIFYFLT